MITATTVQGLKGQVGAVALGMFDGVHVGHQKILGEAVHLASRVGKLSAALTFYPHPAVALGFTVHLLTSTVQRRALIAQQGIDILIEHPFTEQFSQQSPRAFVEYLAQELGVLDLVVGFNYTFGRQAAGSVTTLRELADSYGLRVHEVPAVELEGEVVSSTRIRGLVERGALQEAALCLNRPFSLQGIVAEGDRRGRTLGFPTANITFSHLPILPPFGVYVVRSPIYGFGVGNLGRRPTFPLSKPNFEVFFLDTQILHSLYGEALEVELLAYLREERRFSSGEELKVQVLSDIEMARSMARECLIPDAGNAKIS